MAHIRTKKHVVLDPALGRHTFVSGVHESSFIELLLIPVHPSLCKTLRAKHVRQSWSCIQDLPDQDFGVSGHDSQKTFMIISCTLKYKR